MKIAILTNIPTPYRTSFFNVLNEILERNDQELFVFYCAKSEPNRQWNYVKEENLYPHKILPGLHFNLKSFYPHLNITILREMRMVSPTHLIVAGSWNTPTMILSAFLYNPKNLIKLFWSESHLDSVRYKSNFFTDLKKIFYKRFNYFITPNQKSSKYITDIIGIKNKGNINLPNLVDNIFFSAVPKLNKPLLRQKYGVAENVTVFTQVAQLEDKKGVLELIEGFSLLNEHHKNIYLVLVGEGSLLAQVNLLIKSKKIEEKVKITGHLERDKIKEYLYLSDAFVLSSKIDPNPLSPIEAIFCSLPVLLSSKAGNVNEIVNEGYNGFQLKEITPENISKTLSDFLQLDSGARDKMGSYSSKIALEKFNSELVSIDFVKKLRSLS